MAILKSATCEEKLGPFIHQGDEATNGLGPKRRIATRATSRRQDDTRRERSDRRSIELRLL